MYHSGQDIPPEIVRPEGMFLGGRGELGPRILIQWIVGSETRRKEGHVDYRQNDQSSHSEHDPFGAVFFVSRGVESKRFSEHAGGGIF
jgi:hypothetical protein